MLRHETGRLNPIADHLPARSLIDTSPNTNRIGTSLGTIWKTLWPITKKEPSANSQALTMRESEHIGDHPLCGFRVLSILGVRLANQMLLAEHSDEGTH
jgi:hypothetical protein